MITDKSINKNADSIKGACMYRSFDYNESLDPYQTMSKLGVIFVVWINS